MKGSCLRLLFLHNCGEDQQVSVEYYCHSGKCQGKPGQNSDAGVIGNGCIVTKDEQIIVNNKKHVNAALDCLGFNPVLLPANSIPERPGYHKTESRLPNGPSIFMHEKTVDSACR